MAAGKNLSKRVNCSRGARFTSDAKLPRAGLAWDSIGKPKRAANA